MAKITNKDFNVSGMETSSMFKQLCLCRLMPYTGIGEGPKFAYLARLFKMHTIERQFVQLEVKQPGLYKAYMRVRNSLVFRYNHYRNLLKGDRHG